MTQPAENLAKEGVTTVRELLAPGDAASLRRTVDEIYAVMDSCERFPNRLLGNNFRVWDGVWLRRCRHSCAKHVLISLSVMSNRFAWSNRKSSAYWDPSGDIFPSAPTSGGTAAWAKGWAGTPTPTAPRSFA